VALSQAWFQAQTEIESGIERWGCVAKSSPVTRTSFVLYEARQGLVQGTCKQTPQVKCTYILTESFKLDCKRLLNATIC
jgi:hypothetical protein